MKTLYIILITAGSLLFSDLKAQNCPHAVTPADFNFVMGKVKDQKLEAGRVEVSKKYISKGCMLSAQIGNLLKTFDAERDKVEVAKYAWEFCYDPDNYDDLYNAFSWNNSVEDLKKYMAAHPRSGGGGNYAGNDNTNSQIGTSSPASGDGGNINVQQNVQPGGANINMSVQDPVTGQNVGMSTAVDPNGANININTGTATGGSATRTTTTTTTTTTRTGGGGRGGNGGGSAHGNYNRGNNNSQPVQNNYPGNSCGYPMSTSDFQSAKASITSKSFENTKLEIAKQIGGTHCFTSDQVAELMKVFDFENTKLDFAKFAYDRTVDKANYYKVNDSFEFESSISTLDQYIKSK